MNTQHPLYQESLNRICALELPFEQLRNARILVTGATGMIGACLTDALISVSRRFSLNLHIIAVCRNEARARERFAGAGEVHTFACDLTQPAESLPAADYIIHAASNAHPLAFSSDPVGTILGNILGTRTLLEHLRTSGGKRFLFVSTGEIYGENPDVTDGFAEDSFGKIDSMNPRACYPESKRAAETLCAGYIRQYGADAVVARLCYIYGPTITPDNSRADAQFLRKVMGGEDIVLKSTGTQLRSYCYVADAVSALLTILLKGRCGEAYNVASRSSTHTIREYAEALARIGGVQVVFDLPPEAERQGYSTVSRAVQNPAKLEALGWKAEYTLEDGLRRMLGVLK